jgi:hypothetical protein
MRVVERELSEASLLILSPADKGTTNAIKASDGYELQAWPPLSLIVRSSDRLSVSCTCIRLVPETCE